MDAFYFDRVVGGWFYFYMRSYVCVRVVCMLFVSNTTDWCLLTITNPKIGDNFHQKKHENKTEQKRIIRNRMAHMNCELNSSVWRKSTESVNVQDEWCVLLIFHIWNGSLYWYIVICYTSTSIYCFQRICASVFLHVFFVGAWVCACLYANACLLLIWRHVNKNVQHGKIQKRLH